MTTNKRINLKKSDIFVNSSTFFELKTEFENIIDEFVKVNDSFPSNKTFYLSSSKYTFSSKEQAMAYLSLQNDEKYSSSILDVEYKLLEKNNWLINNFLPSRFSYVDLGPGHALKSKLLLNHFLQNKKIVSYLGVDVSEDILEVASKNLSSIDILKVFYQGDFFSKNKGEYNLRNFLDLYNADSSFFYLGATFGNSTNFLKTNLVSLMSNSDFVYLSAQLFNSISDLKKQYSVDNIPLSFVFGPLKQLGFKKTDVEYIVDIVPKQDSYVAQVKFKIKQNPSNLLLDKKYSNVDLRGLEIVVLGSWKPTKDAFERVVDSSFSGQYFISADSSMMGFIGKKKF